jgi:hypothetical protein
MAKTSAATTLAEAQSPNLVRSFLKGAVQASGIQVSCGDHNAGGLPSTVKGWNKISG